MLEESMLDKPAFSQTILYTHMEGWKGEDEEEIWKRHSSISYYKSSDNRVGIKFMKHWKLNCWDKSYCD